MRMHAGAGGRTRLSRIWFSWMYIGHMQMLFRPTSRSYTQREVPNGVSRTRGKHTEHDKHFISNGRSYWAIHVISSSLVLTSSGAGEDVVASIMKNGRSLLGVRHFDATCGGSCSNCRARTAAESLNLRMSRISCTTRARRQRYPSASVWSNSSSNA